MSTSSRVATSCTSLLCAAWLAQSGGTASAQDATQVCKPPQVIPLASPEPPPRLVVNAPLAGPLATRGVAVITYCAENMRITPVFGSGALSVSPRIGHVHVSVDGAAWHWADASGTRIILRGLPPGRHTVHVELVDADHTGVDKGNVTFEVPVPGQTPPVPATPPRASADEGRRRVGAP